MRKQDANIAVFAWAIQNAIKYFDIDVNKQNPDNYPREKVDEALNVRKKKKCSHDHDSVQPVPMPIQTDRSLFSNKSNKDKDKPKKHKPKYRPSKLLYGALAIYLWREGHKKLAVGTVAAYFIHRHYANNGGLEKSVNYVLAKVTGKGQGRQRALSNDDGSGSDGKGVDLSKFELD